MINALNLADPLDPHITIGMAHHPFHLLQEFDRRPVQSRIERSCQFFHCGHLHEPEARTAGFRGSGCLTLAAGASFEARQYPNTYSFVTLDCCERQRTVKTIQYSPPSGTFSFSALSGVPIEITPAGICSVEELARAMKAYRESLSPWVHYLSALLLDQKSELPIPLRIITSSGRLPFCWPNPMASYSVKTIEFMAFKNVLAGVLQAPAALGPLRTLW